VSKNWRGAGQDLGGGAVPPGPNVEPPLCRTLLHKINDDDDFDDDDHNL